MIDLLEQKIKQASKEVSSSDIVECTKIAGNMAPYLAAGGGGLLLGGLGMNLLNSRSEAKQKKDAERQALLAGLAGATAGYLGRSASAPSSTSGVSDTSSAELSLEDINALFGR